MFLTGLQNVAHVFSWILALDVFRIIRSSYTIDEVRVEDAFWNGPDRLDSASRISSGDNLGVDEVIAWVGSVFFKASFSNPVVQFLSISIDAHNDPGDKSMRLPRGQNYFIFCEKFSR